MTNKRGSERGTPPLYAHECRVRDVFAECLSQLRPDERLVKTELRYSTAARRIDMRTVDRAGTLREWEFKIQAASTSDLSAHLVGRILKRGFDVFGGEPGEVAQDFGPRRSGGEQAEDVRDGCARSADDGLAGRNRRVDGDTAVGFRGHK